MLALASAAVLLLLAWFNESATRGALEQVQLATRDAGQFVDARDAQPGGRARAGHGAGAWGGAGKRAARHIQTRQLGDPAGRRAGSARRTRFFRQSVQVVMMGAAAWLVIQQQATPGVMIAVTIILGRALAPVESLIAHWKSLVEARAAWRRLQRAAFAACRRPASPRCPT